MVIIACGALAREIIELQKLNEWSHIDLRCIPAQIHNYPKKIANAVEEKIIEVKKEGKDMFVAFADCGTGGQLDAVLERHQVKRLPGAHCYEFYATSPLFNDLMEKELGTFFLTDFLARHFDALILEGMGINEYPELQDMYFAHYTKLVYLSQGYNPYLLKNAQKAAERLGLKFEHRHTGFGDLETSLNVIMNSTSTGGAV